MEKRIYIILSIVGLLAGLLTSCAPEKHLPKGEALYTGGSVKFEPPDQKASKLRSDLEDQLRPEPNSSILGFYPKLFFYNISHKPKGKGLNYLLHEKWGAPPVLAGNVDLTANEEILSNFLQNKGFFKAIVKGDTVVKSKKAHAYYTIKGGHRYKIRKVIFPNDSLKIDRQIDSIKKYTLLKPDHYYDLETIKDERVRIKDSLKNRGYFYFSPDNLIMQVDSNQNGKVDIYEKVKPQASELALKTYKIHKINVYANYSLSRDSVIRKAKGIDYKQLHIVDPKGLFRPSIFSRSIYFTPGRLYSLADHELTLNRLVNLGAFKYVKVEFDRLDSSAIGAGYLNTNIYLTPEKFKSLKLEITGNSRSNNYVGSSANLSWQNRNFFKGAELFKLKMGGAFETQVGGNQAASNTYSFSPGISMEVPQFVTPFQIINLSRVMVPKTTFNLNYELLHRQNYYDLNSFNLQAGYQWKASDQITNTLNVFDISYILPSHLTPLFQRIRQNDPTLQQSFRKQFILGTSYRFEYSDRQEKDKKNNLYFNGQADVSGNLFGLFTGKHDYNHQATLLKAPFAQFAKVSGDFRDYLHLNHKGLDWVNRLFMGFGYSYGNSYSLPFVKQFFVGGSNSLRGFRARTLGPGTYHTDSTGFQANEAGDIKLEANSELRVNLISILDAAVFVDAGNIWLLRSDSTRPGGEFHLNDAFNQLAVSSGVGFRFDLSFFVLRFDLAFPLRKPWFPEGHRWVFDQIDFGDKQWRKENLVLNIAIGYPF